MESREGGSYWGKEQVRSPEVGRGGVRRAREVPGEEVRTAATSSSLSSKPCTRAYLFGSAVLCTHSRFFFFFLSFFNLGTESSLAKTESVLCLGAISLRLVLVGGRAEDVNPGEGFGVFPLSQAS